MTTQYEVWNWEEFEENGPVAIFDSPEEAMEYVAARLAFDLKIVSVPVAETTDF